MSCRRAAGDSAGRQAGRQESQPQRRRQRQRQRLILSACMRANTPRLLHRHWDCFESRRPEASRRLWTRRAPRRRGRRGALCPVPCALLDACVEHTGWSWRAKRFDVVPAIRLLGVMGREIIALRTSPGSYYLPR